MSEETLIENPNSETLKPITPSDGRTQTLKQIYKRAGATKFKKRKGKKNIQTLLHTIKPKVFSPKKNLNLDKFDQVLKKLDLFEFTRIEFHPVIRIEFLVELVSSYNPKKKCGYVNGFRINVTKNDLARTLKLPAKKPEKGSAKTKDEVDLDSEVYSEEEIGFIEEFLFNWMLVGDEEMVTPSEIVEWTRCIRDGHPEKMDAAKLIWYKVEKELTQGEKLVDCYYASHLQCLIQSQRPSLYIEDYDGVGVSKEVTEDMPSENKRRKRAIAWDYFEKITGEDGLPKTRCKICNKIYCNLPDSGTSTLRRHLRKCYPQFITQVESLEPLSDTNHTQAIVWDYFEKITGEDGLPKTRCKICNKVYCHLPGSGTQSMRRHLRKCSPQLITQVESREPVPHTDIVMSSSSDESSNEARAAKRLKSSLLENVGNKTDEELLDFIRMNKQNVGILEQNLPEIAAAIKEATKCHEAEIERRARLQRPKESGTGPVTCIMPVKVEVDFELPARYENVGANMVEDGSAIGGEITRTHEDVNQEKTHPQVDNMKLVLEVQEGEQSVSQNESIDGIIAEERAGTLHTVPVNGDKDQENGTGHVTCITPVKVEVDYELPARYENVGANMVEDGSAVGGENTRTHEDVNQEKTRPQVDNIKLVLDVEEGEQSVSQNESIDGIIAEEERAGTLQTVPVNADKNQASTQDKCAGLKKVFCVLSMLSSPNKFYTPQGNPLDEEAEKAKQTLIQLLDKNFETIVGSPDEEMVKSCIKILTENLHKLPRCQGQVIETLNTKFDYACQNWIMCNTNHQSCIAFEVQQEDNLGILKNWQEQDMEIESKIGTVEADIHRLKAELREKELIHESLVKEKSYLFDQSKMSIDEAEKLLQDVVTAKLQSDVAVKNMKELAEDWERTREDFKMQEV